MATWVDVDQPGQLHHVWAFLAERPCHLLAESASGGVHAYWRLDEPLPATRLVERTGELLEPIEQAHRRIIHHLGVDRTGKPNVADPSCKDRSRVMRLAGTVNRKNSRYARIVEADFQLAGYPAEQLVGDFPDPTPSPPTVVSARRGVDHEDPYKRISPPEYFEALVGIDVPARGGLVSCPAPWHQDVHPSCSVGADSTQGWKCHSGSCGAGGAIYDLASVLLGGPWGRELRGEAFKRARAYVADVIGEPT